MRTKRIRALNVIGVVSALVLALTLTGCAPKVPNVVGMPADEAVRTLQAAGYLLGNTTVMFTSGVSADTVSSQRPAAGEQLREGRPVDLTIAKALGSLTVPDVTGKTEAEAASIMASASLVATSVPLYSETIESGIVGGQVPAAGAKSDPGAVVVLAVSKGKTPPTVKVPKIIGMKQADAEAALKDAGLVPDPYPVYSDSVSKGTVGDQTPPSGKSVAPESKVAFIVSLGKGASSATVPDVKGKTVSAAKSSIESAGLKSSVSSVSDPTVKKDVVISQMPPSGTPTTKGGTVGLVVSTGAEAKVAVPNLIGLTADKAQSSIAAAGFVAYRIDQASTQTAGTVIEQLPKASDMVPAGWPIAYAVSSGPPSQ